MLHTRHRKLYGMGQTVITNNDRVKVMLQVDIDTHTPSQYKSIAN